MVTAQTPGTFLGNKRSFELQESLERAGMSVTLMHYDS